MEQFKFDRSPGPEMFDFENNWHVVSPFVNEPKLVELLTRQMNQYIDNRYELHLKNHRPLRMWEQPYNHDCGPWAYTETNYWLDRADESAAEAIKPMPFNFDHRKGISTEEAAEYLELVTPFYPQPDTPDWYRLLGGGRWLAPWLQALGQRAFPDLDWHVSGEVASGSCCLMDSKTKKSIVLETLYHSFAYATDDEKTIRMVFDILKFRDMDAVTLIELACPNASSLN
jgi:hypothetical protein